MYVIYMVPPLPLKMGCSFRPGVLCVSPKARLALVTGLGGIRVAATRTPVFQSRRRTRTYFTFGLEPCCKQVEALRRFPDPISAGLAYIGFLSIYLYFQRCVLIFCVISMNNSQMRSKIILRAQYCIGRYFKRCVGGCNFQTNVGYHS